jgi:diguanylate cyclase (GGDEF)-like protein/PAS domain S-box-containing protein
MGLTNIAPRWSIAAAALILPVGIAIGAWFLSNRYPAPQRSVRVGVDHSPPFYSIHPDGSVDGLAVDVLNEAARRRGIKLLWTPLHDTPLDTALARRVVQIWPLVAATPDRRAKLYLTEPWLESDYILLSLQEHPIRNANDAAGQVVAHARLRFTKMIADQRLSRSKELIRIFRVEAIQAVCTGDAAAALVEGRVLDAILLARPPGCEAAHFHISALPGAVSSLRIAAVPEARATAMALRDEIRNLTADGFLGSKLDEWSPFSASGTRSIWAEQDANKRSKVYRFFLVLIVALALGLAWLAWRAWHLKLAAESADAGRREAQRRFTAFMENSPAMAFMKDSSGRMIYVNKALSQLMGRDPEECIGKDDFTLWPARVAKELRAADLLMLSKNKPVQLIERIPGASQNSIDLLVVKFPFEGAKGEKFIGGTAIDITEREAAIRGLAASEMRYRELFEQNPIPAWVYDRTTLAFLTVNVAAIARYGWTRQDFLSGMTLPDVLAPEEVAGRDVRSEGLAGERAARHLTKDGLLLTVNVTSYELEYEGRQACLMIVRDLTELERTLDQLRVSEERWQLALRGAGDALWDWDLATNRVFRSTRWCGMLGYEEWEIGNSHDDFVKLLHPDDVEATEARVKAHLEKKTAVFSAEYRLRHKDATWRWIMDRGQAIWDDRGRPVRMAGSHTDITERKHAEDLLSLQARTDALTGLPNRWEFQRLFGKLLRMARESGTPLTVCVCDLDRFKAVNDTYGHAAGDHVLIAFGDILRRHLRKTDILARIGGDEFILAMPGTPAQAAGEVMEHMRRELSARVFEWAGATFRISSSFGVAPLRPSHQSGEDLIAEADRYLYDAKEAGRDRTLVAA